jgi:hypothetical protein
MNHYFFLFFVAFFSFVLETKIVRSEDNNIVLAVDSISQIYQLLFVHSNIFGATFLITSVSTHMAIAYGITLSKYKGSSFKNVFIIFSSHASRKYLYQ